MAERSPEGAARWLASMLTVSGIVVASVVLRVWPSALSMPTPPPAVAGPAGGAPFKVQDPGDEGVVVLPRVHRPPIDRPSVLPPVASGGLVIPPSPPGETYPTPEHLPELPVVAFIFSPSFGTPVTPTATVPGMPRDDANAVRLGEPVSIPPHGAVTRAFASVGRGVGAGLRAAGAGIRAAF